MTQAKAGIIAERGIERKKKEIEKDQADENRRLAAEQRAKMDYLDKEVYTNPPTAAYFMQYNTTSRWGPLNTLWKAVMIMYKNIRETCTYL